MKRALGAVGGLKSATVKERRRTTRCFSHRTHMKTSTCTQFTSHQRGNSKKNVRRGTSSQSGYCERELDEIYRKIRGFDPPCM